MTVYINDVAVIGPGLVSKEQTRSVLCGQSNWKYAQLPALKPEMLPANERRRTTPIIKLALECIQGLIRDADDLQTLSTVFASSDGDLGIADKICAALAEEDKIISPTLFHNSVYNAPAGYWSIAALMGGASTSLSAGDASFMCGLLEAVTQVEVDGATVLYVAYDYPAPALMDACRHFDYPLAIAMRLGAEAEDKDKVPAILTLDGAVEAGASAGEKQIMQSYCKNTSLEPLRTASPVGSGLPLVEALVRKARIQLVLPYLRGEGFCIQVSH